MSGPAMRANAGATAQREDGAAPSQDRQDKVIPYLWFDDRAEEAARLYASLFEGSSVGPVTRYDAATAEVAGRPEGSPMSVSFRLAGQEFMALEGGPLFAFTPAISFSVVLEDEAGVDALWRGLVEGGGVLMPLQAYPWSDRYGWLVDRYGVSWQISLGERGDAGRTITPSLLFVGEQCGRAEEAIRHYASVFGDATVGDLIRYGAGEAGGPEGAVQHARFTLHGHPFTAMDSALEHDFTFTEATSFLVRCESQEEIDRYWEGLSAHPEAEQCGWLKDRFGVSWQIVPAALPELLSDPDPEAAQRISRAFLGMKKLDIAGLERARG